MIIEYGIIDAREAKTPPISLEILKPTSGTDKLANID
jgi:hypothetical protein